MTLGEALTVGKFHAIVTDLGDRVEVRWENPDLTPHGIVDIKHPASVAEATIVRQPDGAGEWTRLVVQPDAQRNGILTACFRLERAVLEDNGMWPAYVNAMVPQADFYEAAAMPRDDQGRLVFDPDAARAWRP